jgi:hypothetical protein
VLDATPADYAAIDRLFPLLGVHDPLPSSSHFERQMLPQALVAEVGGRWVAYAHWRYYGATAHVVHAVVDAPARGCGVGAVLTCEMKRRSVDGGAGRRSYFRRTGRSRRPRRYSARRRLAR